MLNNSGGYGHPCLVPYFTGNAFNFSPLRIMFAIGLSDMDFILLRYIPSMPAFKTLQMVITAMKLKDACSLEEKL